MPASRKKQRQRAADEKAERAERGRLISAFTQRRAARCLQRYVRTSLRRPKGLALLKRAFCSAVIGRAIYKFMVRKKNSIVRATDKVLECKICLQLCSVPTMCLCGSLQLVCLDHAITHFELDNAPLRRSQFDKRCCCGCSDNMYDLRRVWLLDLLGSKDFRIDELRDGYGRSRCFACKKSFRDVSSARAHIRECDMVSIPCNKSNCDFFGTRSEVKAHIRECHDILYCPVCCAGIKRTQWNLHVRRHIEHLLRVRGSETGTRPFASAQQMVDVCFGSTDPTCYDCD